MNLFFIRLLYLRLFTKTSMPELINATNIITNINVVITPMLANIFTVILNSSYKYNALAANKTMANPYNVIMHINSIIFVIVLTSF